MNKHVQRAGIGALLLMLMVPVTVFFVYLAVKDDLPDVSTLKDIRLQTPLRIYTDDGLLLGEFGEKRRIPVQFDDIPPSMVQAFLAAEDDRFYDHPGVDYKGLLRAAIVLLLTGEKKQGGSTITMQLARNYFLSNERTYIRKIKEIFLALMIERQFDKQEILNLYLNKVFLGQRAYGVGAAAEVYYGKSLAELDLAEIAMIAGLPKAPSLHNPIANPNLARQRRNYVLGRMHELAIISNEEYRMWSNADISSSWHRAPLELEAAYVAEMVRQELLARYQEEVYTGAYEVYTTIQSDLQRYANAALRRTLINYDKRHGYRGAEQNFDLSQFNAAEYQQLLAQFSVAGGLLPALVTDISATTATALLASGQQLTLSAEAVAWARQHINENRRGKTPKTPADVLQPGDIIRVALLQGQWQLRQLPQVEGALLALSPEHGGIVALVGGFDFSLSHYNRAIQAQRQPGSSFKPFIYATAFAQAYTPASLVNDAPLVFNSNRRSKEWRPSNYSGKFFGPIRLRDAFTHSRNLVSVRLLDTIGIRTTLDYLNRFGFERANLPYNLTLALGSGNVTPLGLAEKYAVFANGGFAVKSHIIKQVRVMGKTIYQAHPAIACAECLELIADASTAIAATTITMSTQVKAAQIVSQSNHGGQSSYLLAKPHRDTNTAGEQYPLARQVIPSDIAYQITSLMKSVIQEGTGRRAKVLNREDLAGKTGTTNDQRDAWFSGFNPQLVCTTWVGFDQLKPLGTYETGGRAALPMWIDFMRQALKNQPQQLYYRPANIVNARIDPDNGLLAHPMAEDSILETFRAEYLPKEIADAPPDDNVDEQREAVDGGLF